jgi:hypothetical protein
LGKSPPLLVLLLARGRQAERAVPAAPLTIADFKNCCRFIRLTPQQNTTHHDSSQVCKL